MTTYERRVVVTGVGVVSPVGIGHQDLWKNLLAGRSGVTRISLFDPDAAQLEVKIAAEVTDFSIADFFPNPRKVGSMMKEMDRVTLFAMAAAKLALEDSCLDVKSSPDADRVGTFIGTGVG